MMDALKESLEREQCPNLPHRPRSHLELDIFLAGGFRPASRIGSSGIWLLPHPEQSNHTTEISFPPEYLRIQCRKSFSPRWICEIHCRALVPLGTRTCRGALAVSFCRPTYRG